MSGKPDIFAMLKEQFQIKKPPRGAEEYEDDTRDSDEDDHETNEEEPKDVYDEPADEDDPQEFDAFEDDLDAEADDEGEEPDDAVEMCEFDDDDNPEGGVEADDDQDEPESKADDHAAAPRRRKTRPEDKASDDFCENWLLRREPGDRGTFVPGWVMRVCRHEPAQMLILAQLAYWFGRSKTSGECRARMRVPGDPHRWVVKTYRELGREVGMSVWQTRTALAGLVDARLVEKCDEVFRGRKANRLRINRKTVEQESQFDE